MRNCYQDKSSTNNITYVYCRTLRYVRSKKQQQNSNNIPCKLCLTPSYIPDIKWSQQNSVASAARSSLLIQASQVARSSTLKDCDNILCPSLCWNLSHRPEAIDEFYWQPIDSPKENIWYKKLPMKRNGLANIMKRMAEKAKIKNEGNFTNTSGRKTAIQSLRGHFDPLAISELIGHANPSSIQSYSHDSIQTQKEMATLARSSSTAAYNNTASTVNASSSNQRQFSIESLFNNNTLNSCQKTFIFQLESDFVTVSRSSYSSACARAVNIYFVVLPSHFCGP